MRILALTALFALLMSGCRGTSADTFEVAADGTVAVSRDATVKQGAAARFAFVLERTESMDASATHYYLAYVDSDDPSIVTATRTAATVRCPLKVCDDPLSVWELRGLAVGTTSLLVTSEDHDGDYTVVVHVLP